MSSAHDVTDGVCVVCFKSIEIFSIGECDHPVCFECSTRMRVLCLQTECPICRHDLSKVFFAFKSDTFKNLESMPFKNSLFEKKYKICFLNDIVKEAYQKLLEHYCRKCQGAVGPFHSFVALKDHMRKEHELFFCDLCVENLKIFTNERKFYTRQQLGMHRRKGDPDDTSHKGHPLCEFCDTRYMDTDELYRHLRKDHLYCHLCDADGFHQFYGSYNSLKGHFRKDHYLCDEGECGEQNLTGVFRTDIDLKAHKALEHGRGLSKQAARQARTLDLQFTLTPRASLPPRQHHRLDRVEPERETVYENVREETGRSAPSPPPAIDTGSTKHFPTLGDAAPPTLNNARLDKPVARQTSGALARTHENFPALSSELASSTPTPSTSFRVNITHQNMPGPSSAIIRTNGKPNVSIQVHSRPQSSGNRFKITETSNKQLAMKLADTKQQLESNKNFMDEFPSLNKKDRNLLFNDYASSHSSPTTIAKKVSIPTTVLQTTSTSVYKPPPVSAPSPPSLDAFPALQSSNHTLPSNPKWITAKSKDTNVKVTKPKSPPPVAKPFLNNLTDFPVPPTPCVQPHWIKDKLKDQTLKPKFANTSKELSVYNISTSPSTSSQPQWITHKTKESTIKASKVAPAPQFDDEPSFTDVSDFPLLKSKQKNKKNEKVICSSTQQLDDNNCTNSANKKDKRKSKNNANSDLSSFNFSSGPKDKNTDKENNNKSKKNVKSPIDVKDKKNISQKNGHFENKCNNTETISINSNDERNESLASMKSRPPPGMNDQRGLPVSVSFHGAIPPCNGFTFTNSSGQNFSIPAHNYIQPFNFNERNKILVTRFMEVLDAPEAIHEFKQFSQMFREGSFTADSYYNHCITSMGKHFDDLFPELLVLLPDISKQQELLSVYVDSGNSNLEVCQVCGQVLVDEDVKNHSDFHTMQSSFPALGPPLSSVGIRQK